MALVDFTTNPFTVLAAPSGGTITPVFDGGESMQTLQFSPGAWQLFLPLSHTSGHGVDDWYGTARLYSDGAHIHLYTQLLDATNDYGSDTNELYPLFPPAPHWGSAVNLGTHDTDPGLNGFQGTGSSVRAIGSGFGLRVHIGGDFGAQFSLGALDVTVVTSPRTTPTPGEIDFTGTLAVEDSFSLSLVDVGAPPPSGTGRPPRYSDGDFLDSCDPTSTIATVCTRTQRSIPTALAAHLQGEALTLAYCLRLARRDGVTLGFTTHDGDLTFGGVTYEALNSLSVTALRQELGGQVGSMDLAGLIRSDRVTAADLLAGRYDGAELTLFLVNWASLADGFITLSNGWWGALTTVDGQWHAEYRSLAQRLQQQIVEITSSTCRVAQLGDERCKVNLTPFQFSRIVTAVTDNRTFTFGADSHAAGYFNAGRVIWTSGANSGLEQEVKRNTPSGGAQGIELQLAAPFAVAVGDTATLEAGCDRRLVTCRDRFGNTINFRGEPNVPGSEVLRRTASLVVVG